MNWLAIIGSFFAGGFLTLIIGACLVMSSNQDEQEDYDFNYDL